MHAVLTLAGLALLAGAAQAQRPGVAVPPDSPGYTYGKAQDAGEARRKAREQGKVLPPGGDAAKSAEGGAIGTDASAAAGQERIRARDARRPDKRRPMPGPTPDDAVRKTH